MELAHHFVDIEGGQLHYVAVGQGYPLIFLHGFPACWYVWRQQLEALQTHFRVIAPDGCGVNMSTKPQALSAYQIDTLAQGIIALADALELQTFGLVGHDWGGTLAWKIAQRYPQRVDKLLVVNAPPLEALLYALATLPQQREASAYVTRLKADTAAATLLANQCAYLWQVSFAGLMARGVYTTADRDFYVQSWQIPRALDSFLNWYRANLPDFDLIASDQYHAEQVTPIRVPTLLLWGEYEQAFTRDLLALLSNYAPRLEVVQVAGADHWIMLEQATVFNQFVMRFFTDER
jgi:epoxide hydrolase 4